MTTTHLARAVSTPLPSARRGPRIRIFNVKFSPNLGDGLLSECLEHALIECGADRDTRSIDLAGRTAYTVGSPARALQLQILDSLPRSVRSIAVRAPLAIQSRRRWAPHYAHALADAECVVIGGGNLLADLDLNFPTKISLALAAASWRRLPVFIYGCGVSGGWSRQGRFLLERAVKLGTIRKVWLRDERSRQIWNDLIGSETGLEAALVRDPGLLASERYPMARKRRQTNTPVIGLNLTSPHAVRYHSDAALPPARLDRWYIDFAHALLGKGYRLAVFCNGSPEDREYTKRLRPRLEALEPLGRITFPDARRPAQLSALIAGCEAIAAFRMHAIIAAYSLGVPFLALPWDPKLDSFVHSVGKSHWLCAPANTPARDAAQRLIGAIEQGVRPLERASVIAETKRGVAELYKEIVGALD
jgi:polysaccharide pyruvyl transferase WcaK-like protein